MYKITFLILALVLAIFAFVVSKQPEDFRVSRSIKIAAPAAKIFAEINDPRKFNEWSPWAKLDPNAKVTYEGPATGVGSKMSWEGNMEVGAGSMILIESRPPQFLKFELAFLKPMKATHNSEFTLAREGKQTNVTWTMYGKNNFLGKAMSLVMDCNKMIGEQFDKGLLNLKSTVESK